MSWTAIFPYLSNDLLDDFQANATPEDKAQLEEWLGVKKIYNRQASKKKVVSTTLFWKHVGKNDPDMPVPSMERLVQSKRLGLVKRFDAYESYVEPLLLHGEELCESFPDVCFRIHLANDLAFLADELAGLGYEVHLMRSSSLRYCPGGFWRFLPLGEKGKLVTVMDSDRMGEAKNEIARTDLMATSGLGLWRVPGYYNSEVRDSVPYRPILGGHFGAKGGLPIRLWIEAFIWHGLRGTLPKHADVPGCGSKVVTGCEWPAYGYDEFWQLMIYPRLAPRGVLTFLPTDARSLFIPIDIEYTTWANSRSEIVYSQVGGKCC